MSDWSHTLEVAIQEADSGCAKTAFDKAFNALEICYSHQANIPLDKQSNKIKIVIDSLLKNNKISRDEYDLAEHLRQARNVVTHKFGLAITMEEAKRCIDRVRKLCLRFAGTIADVMARPVVCAKPRDELGDFVRMMRDNGFSQFPVVNDEKEMVGTLDEKSVFHALDTGDGHIDLCGPVSAFMRSELLPTLAPETSIEKARQEMHAHDVAAFIVLLDRKPEGIITKFELIR